MKDANVMTEVNRIVSGCGWASDEYVLNTPDLSDKEKLRVMEELAKLRKLYSEESIEDKLSDCEPKKGHMTVEQVRKEYSHLND